MREQLYIVIRRGDNDTVVATQRAWRKREDAVAYADTIPDYHDPQVVACGVSNFDIVDDIHKPEWMNDAQFKAVGDIYDRQPDGSKSLADFIARVKPAYNFCGLTWCGMFLGIEKDGYTHS